MIRSGRTLSLLVILFVASATLTACQKKLAPPLSDADIQRLTEGEPQIFVEKNGTLTLEGIEDLYLGQSKEDAMKVLTDYCGTLEVFDGGWRHNQAVFKGCIIDDGPQTKTLRAGFWPHNGDRLSTLEIKDRPLNLAVVRARFSEFADELTEDLPRRGILMMATPDYRLFANWDEGQHGHAHLIIGFQP